MPKKVIENTNPMLLGMAKEVMIGGLIGCAIGCSNELTKEDIKDYYKALKKFGKAVQDPEFIESVEKIEAQYPANQYKELDRGASISVDGDLNIDIKENDKL